ncbi:MAG: hypothetical protein WC654_05105 [Patescibacteria group bacterium]
MPASLDPGSPISTSPVYFWVWVAAVRVYLDPAREQAPLNARMDLFPIIRQYHRPRPGAARYNPSWYISKMKKLGLMRLFSSHGKADYFWVPETSVVLSMNKVIVYTPDDLTALLAQDARFMPPGGQVSKETSGVQEPVPVEANEETPVSDLSRLDMASLKTALAHEQARFDITKLEVRQKEFTGLIEEKEARADALRREAETLDAQAKELDLKQQNVELEISRLQREEAENQKITDLRWLIENHERLVRLMEEPDSPLAILRK